MSAEDLKAFFARLETDPALQEKARALAASRRPPVRARSVSSRRPRASR